MMDQQQLMGTAKILVYFSLWYALNAAYNVYNKKVLLVISIPWTLATTQFVIGTFVFLPLWATGLRPVPRFAWKDLKWLLPLGFYNTLIHISSVIALGAGAVSLFQILKAAEPLFTAIAAAIVYKQFFHPVIYLCILPVVGGVGYAASSTADFAWMSFIGAMLSNIGSVARSTASKPYLTNPPEGFLHMSPGNLYCLLTLISVVFCLPVMVIAEWAEIYNLYNLTAGNKEHDLDVPMSSLLLWTLISGITFYTYNEVAFYALGEVHAITHAVGNALKRVVILLASVVFLGEFMSTQTIIGTAIAISGVLAYSLSKNYFGAKKTEAPLLQVDGIQDPNNAEYTTLDEEDQA